MRNYKLIEDFGFDGNIITFGTTVYLKNIETGEEKIITILGIPDIKFNPRYNKDRKRYLGYPNRKLVRFIGKKKGDVIEP